MQRVTVLCVGKLKEKFYTDAAAEYVKRLQRYCKLDVVELPEYRLPEEPSPAEIQKALQTEGAAIRERLPRGGAVVALCIEDASYVHALSGRLYPEVALRLGATPSGVERAIRTAIHTAWQNGGIQSCAAVISDPKLADGRPTAGRLIDCLAHACVQTMKN